MKQGNGEASGLTARWVAPSGALLWAADGNNVPTVARSKANEAGKKERIPIMFSPIVAALIALLMFACGDAEDTIDGHEEYGTAEQGMSTRFSSTFSHGVSTGAQGLKCTIAGGAGSGQSCMLPSIGTVKYMFGSFTPGLVQMDVPARARSFFSASIRPDNWGQPMPFGTAVEVTSGANVVIQQGPCPGNSMSNNIWSFGCLSWQGGATTVTESLTGTYKRFTGVLYINIDLEKINERVALQPWGGESFDEYELTEHALGSTLPAIYGQGVYNYDVTYPGRLHRTWSSRYVHNSTTGYEAGGYTVGEMCRMGYWSSQFIGIFEASSDGTCANAN